MENMKCSKCEGEMEEGIVRHEGNRWVERSDFFGITSSVGFVGKEVITFRCKVCGFLESYAK